MHLGEGCSNSFFMSGFLIVIKGIMSCKEFGQDIMKNCNLFLNDSLSFGR